MDDYNGWTNKPTWLLYTWLSNDHESYQEMQQEARIARRTDDPARTLANVLRERTEAMIPEPAGLETDLMTFVISHIDFMEVAEAFLSEAKNG